MNSNNGDLYFRAGIDLDTFNAGAEAMEQRMRGVTSTIVGEAGKMDDALSAVGSAFTRIAGVGAAGAFVKQMFNVRSEMQNTEAMLRVFLGSAEKANDFFKSLQGYAYNNVFEFADLAKQSAQLLAYKTNVEDVIPTLNKLSEIAAGTNAPLENLVSTFNKVKANNKLDSYAIYSLGNMGIDVYQTLADIKSLETGTLVLRDAVKGTSLEFKDLEKVIDHVTTNGGMYEGMMVEKMKTLGDSMGLMQDNLTNMFNEIGEQTQGLMKGAMDVANFLIGNYEEVAKVLATLVVAYGAVKAANIAMSLAQKNGTGVAVMDNTVRAIQAKLLKEEIKGRTDVKKSIEAQRKQQQEEIDTLRAAITEREHAEMVDKARVATLDNILTQSQKAQLQQMGLNSAMSEYLPVAVDMLDKQQAIAFQQSELTNNNQAYIDSMREVLGIHADEKVSIDDRISAAQELLAAAEAEQDTAQSVVDNLKEEIDQYSELASSLTEQGDAIGAQEAAEIKETLSAKLETAQKNAETAAENRNTAQRRLNELQTKKETLANTKEAASSTLAAKAKLVLTNSVKLARAAFQKLWATLMSNPLILIATAIAAVVSGLTMFIRKNKEAKEEQAEHNKELAKFNTEVDAETTRVNNLISTIKHSTKGTAAYTKSMQELNKICKEYNVTAFNAIEPIERQREAYEALTAAIKAKVAAKILEKAQEQAQSDKEARDADLITETVDMMSKKQNVGKGKVRDFFRDEEYARQRDLFMTAMQGEAAVVAAGMEKGDEAVKKLIKTFEEFTGETIAGKAKLTLETMFTGFVVSAQKANAEVSEATKIAEVYTQKEQKTNEATATGKQRIKELTEQLAKLKKEREEIMKLDLTEAELKERLDAKDDEIKAVNDKLKLYNGGTTSTTSGNDVAKKRKEYAEQQKKDAAMLQYDIEDARIQAMEVGTERQLAQMHNDFNRKMEELVYERKEIDKKRKELGLSAIDWDETDEGKMGSEQKRMKQKQDALIQSYNQQMKSVYNGEVDRMKALYEQYDRWVEALGQEAADKRFKNLLPKGEDYGAWLSNTILETQEQLDTISEDDPKREALLQYLFQLQQASDELFGIESKMNKFLRELSENLDDAGSGAEKLAVLNREMERLQNADPTLGLTGNQISALIVHLRQQIRDTKKQIDKAFEDNYTSYIVNRVSMSNGYERDIQRLLKEDRLMMASALQQNMQTALKEYDEDFIKSLVGAFFAEPTKKNMSEALKTLERLQKMSLEQFNKEFGTEGYEFTEEQLASIKNRIGDIGREIKKLGDGYTLADAFAEIKEGRLSGDLEKVANGVKKIHEEASPFLSIMQDVGSELSSIGDSVKNGKMKAIGGFMSSFATSIDKIMDGFEQNGWYGAAIASVQSLVSTVMQLYALVAQSQYKMEQAQLSYKDAILELSLTLKDIYDNGFGVLFFKRLADATDKAKSALDKYNEAASSIDPDKKIKTGLDIGFGDFLQDIAHFFTFGLVHESDVNTYEKLKDLIPEAFDANGRLADIEALRTAYESGIFDEDSKFKDTVKEVLALYDKWIENQQVVADGIKEVFGYLGDDAISSLTDALINNGNAWETWRKKGSQAIETLGEQLMYELFLASHFDDFKKRLDEIWTSTNYSAEEMSRESVKAMDEFFDGIEDDMNRAQEFGERWRQFANERGFDIWSNADDESTLTGSIQNLSEETGGIIAGRMNAMVINQAETTSVLRQSLLVQYEINNHLATIEVDVAQIKRSVSQQSVPFNENMNYGQAERIRFR